MNCNCAYFLLSYLPELISVFLTLLSYCMLLSTAIGYIIVLHQCSWGSALLIFAYILLANLYYYSLV